MNDIPINRGSDLTFTGTWRNENGQPVNLAGWTIAAFDAHPLAAGMTVAWVDAALGQYSATLPWSDAMPTGRIINFRLRVSLGQDDRSSPKIWVVVQ